MSKEESGKVDFSGLVAGLAASAVSVLAQVENLRGGGGTGEGESLKPEERRKRITDGLSGARQLIDTLVVLEKKTEGNLSEDEKQLLQSALSELRIRYVELANRADSGDEAGEGETA